LQVRYFPINHHHQGLLPKHLLGHHQAHQTQQGPALIHTLGQKFQWQQLDHLSQLMH
jgi:hypothetical protein